MEILCVILGVIVIALLVVTIKKPKKNVRLKSYIEKQQNIIKEHQKSIANKNAFISSLDNSLKVKDRTIKELTEKVDSLNNSLSLVEKDLHTAIYATDAEGKELGFFRVRSVDKEDPSRGISPYIRRKKDGEYHDVPLTLKLRR